MQMYVKKLWSKKEYVYITLEEAVDLYRIYVSLHTMGQLREMNSLNKPKSFDEWLNLEDSEEFSLQSP